MSGLMWRALAWGVLWTFMMGPASEDGFWLSVILFVFCEITYGIVKEIKVETI